jgi:hypothetical protein
MGQGGRDPAKSARCGISEKTTEEKRMLDFPPPRFNLHQPAGAHLPTKSFILPGMLAQQWHQTDLRTSINPLLDLPNPILTHRSPFVLFSIACLAYICYTMLDNRQLRIYEVRAHRKMPAVKKLHQESESNNARPWRP